MSRGESSPALHGHGHDLKHEAKLSRSHSHMKVARYDCCSELAESYELNQPWKSNQSFKTP